MGFFNWIDTFWFIYSVSIMIFFLNYKYFRLPLKIFSFHLQSSLVWPHLLSNFMAVGSILFQGWCCKRHKEMEQWFHLLCTATHTKELNLIIDNLSTFLYQNTDKTEVDTCIHWEKHKFYFNIARQVLTFNEGNACEPRLQSKFSFFVVQHSLLLK